MTLTRTFIGTATLSILSCSILLGADGGAMPHVRSQDATIACALSRGYERSPTFRALIDRLDASNVIVHVGRAPLDEHCDGKTTFVVASGGYRFVRITVRGTLVHDALVALLGHELQHAAEVADAPWVTDLESYGMLYEQIGRRSPSCRSGRCFDTRAAVESGYQVLAELRRGHALVANLHGSIEAARR